MRFLTLKRFGIVLMLVVAIGLFIFITSHAQANSPVAGKDPIPALSADWALAENRLASPQLAATPLPQAKTPVSAATSWAKIRACGRH